MINGSGRLASNDPPSAKRMPLRMQSTERWPSRVRILSEFTRTSHGDSVHLPIWRPKILISDSRDFLFYSCSNNGSKIMFTLMDRSGNIVKNEELPLTLECFVKVMKNIGYNAIWD
ncbi:MAG TPA: hypothetical protein VE378_05780 [Nitrososphaeraceae archaeon]|nr:hypothetical protein [Nitrososphaeraceae archaeon]